MDRWFDSVFSRTLLLILMVVAMFARAPIAVAQQAFDFSDVGLINDGNGNTMYYRFPLGGQPGPQDPGVYADIGQVCRYKAVHTSEGFIENLDETDVFSTVKCDRVAETDPYVTSRDTLGTGAINVRLSTATLNQNPSPIVIGINSLKLAPDESVSKQIADDPTITINVSYLSFQPLSCQTENGPLVASGFGMVSQKVDLSNYYGSSLTLTCDSSFMELTISVEQPDRVSWNTSSGDTLHPPIITHGYKTGNFAVISSLNLSSSQAKYKIVKSVGDDIAQMDPQVKACGQLGQQDPAKPINLSCIDTKTGNSVACTVNLSLELGTENGGHDHTSGRPLGAINGTLITSDNNAVVPVSIPAGGVIIAYQSPDVSGDVKLKFDAKGPNGLPIAVNPTKIHVKNKGSDNWQAVNAPGLSISVTSHPQGVYVTKTMNANVATMASLFPVEAAELTTLTPPDLRSEAASLPLGGLFDANWNGLMDAQPTTPTPWQRPHCSHRDGLTIDISQSNFPPKGSGVFKIQFRLFEEALRRATNKARISLFSIEGNHWHLHK